MKGEKINLNDLRELGCRIFEPSETMAQLAQIGREKFLKWGIDRNLFVVNLTDDEKSDDREVIGFVMKCNHPNYPELIYITLSFLDYYNVYFLDSQWMKQDNCLYLLEKFEEISAEDLFDTIDRVLNSIVKVPINFNNN